MGWHMDDWSWGWLLMTATMVAFWALVAWVVVVAIRASRSPTAATRSGTDPRPEFAAGEIDEHEYQRHLDALRSAAKPS